MDAVAKLLAQEEIRQLKSRYFRTMDTRDWKGMSQVFTSDIVFEFPEGDKVTRGREAVMKWIEGAFAEMTSVHHGHCHEITIDSDTEAHGVIAMEDFIRGLDRKTVLYHGTGHYTESYRIEDGQWRIAKTRLTRLFSDTADAGAMDRAINNQERVKA
jgi:uncharacterized protein (TIGR02246 family)